MRLSSSKKVFAIGMAALLLAIFSLTAKAAPPLAPAQAEAVARIEHIAVGGQDRTEVGEAEARVIRASGNQVQPAKAGMLLYANDQVATGNNVKLTIRSLNVPKENDPKVILYQNTQVRVVDNTSYAVILGRAWFGVKGLFNVRTFFWILGARGTEFEVQTDNSGGSTTLTVLDGVVSVTGTDAVRERAPRRAPAVPLEVKALEEVSLNRSPTPATKPKALTQERVRAILNATNDAILASQPAHPARRVIPHFDSVLERGRAFQSARFDAIWRRDAVGLDTLGNVYSDWGEGAKALEAYNKELSRNPLLQNSVALLTNIGEAYRLIGELDKAEESLAKAIVINQYWAPALNALGNVYFGKAAIARRDKDLDAAKKFLQKATDSYEQSFRSVARYGGTTHNAPMVEAAWIFGAQPFIKVGGALQATQQNSPLLSNQSRGVTKVNIGDAKSLLADIAVEEGDPEEAERLYGEAERAYLEAKEFYPQYPYVERGLTRVARAIEALAASASTTRPVTPGDSSRLQRGNKLDVPIGRVTTENSTLYTATSIAAVVSYLSYSDAEPCRILSLMNTAGDCCERANSRFCLYPAQDIFTTMRRVNQTYNLTGDVAEQITYREIATRIDMGLPMVALISGALGRAVVISGYNPPAGLIILDPSLPGEKSIEYDQLRRLGWDTTIRFPARAMQTPSDRLFMESADRIVELILDRDFDAVTDRFSLELRRRLSRNMLAESWMRYVRPLGTVTRGSARIKSGRNQTEVSITCRSERGSVNFLMTFDENGRVIGLLIRPDSRNPYNGTTF
jgi:tetratricopeptide (TPR) repeat protein